MARLKKKQFKAADKTPYGYDQQPFKLDGRMDLDIMFNDKEIHTPVYIKADAKDSLLLSEGVCHQLGILTYHPDVQLLKKPRKKPQTKEAAQVSSVQVSLVQSVKLVPFHNTVADVKVSTQEIGLFLFEPDSLMLSPDVRVREGLLSTGDDGTAHIVLENASGFTQMVEKNTEIGRGYTATVVDLESVQQLSGTTTSNEDQKLYDYLAAAGGVVRQVHTEESESTRGEKLIKALNWEKTVLESKDLEQLQSVLVSHNDAFSLSQEERGETDLVRLSNPDGRRTTQEVTS